MVEKRPVLIIDDDPDFLEYMEIVLRARGYLVRTATSADRGLAMMQEVCPCVVIADVMMSYVLDGWVVGRRMHEDARLRQVPLIMVSAIVSDMDGPMFPSAEAAHYHAFLSKPINPDTLLETMSRLLQTAPGEGGEA